MSSVKKIVKKTIDPFGLGRAGLEALGVARPDGETATAPGAVAPDPDAEAAAKAESRRLQRRKRSGRTSTVLSEGSNLG